MAKPVTREEKENSKKEFDELILLINQELKGVEGWLLKTATPKLTNLSKLLTGDLGNADKRWECEAEIRIAKTYTKQGQTKIDYVESLVGKLNDQVLRAPIKVKSPMRIPANPGCTKPGKLNPSLRITGKPSIGGLAGV